MNDSASSLYSAWFDALPAFFRSMTPMQGFGFVPPAIAATAASSMPFPADQVTQALNMTSGLLGQLYQSYVPMLTQGGFGADAMKALSNAATDAQQKLQQMLQLPAGGWPDMQLLGGLGQAQPAQAWNTLMGSSGGDASRLLQLGMQRTFGGLSDAFGLRPARELDEAFREMATASVAKQRTQLEYLALWTEAWNEGTQRLVKELTAMGARGERVDSMLALLRLWAKNVDGAVHEAMQSERGLKITANVIRAASTHREQVQKAVGVLSQALYVPTREEMDLAYREIQELKRELRRVKKALPAEARKKLMEAKEGHE